MYENVRELLTLAFSAGGIVGWVRAKIRDIEDRLTRLERDYDEEEED